MSAGSGCHDFDGDEPCSSVVSPTFKGIPAEVHRLVVSHLDTPSLLLSCRGVLPVLSAVVADELRLRRKHYLTRCVMLAICKCYVAEKSVLRFAGRVEELLQVMRQCHAVLIGQSALLFLLDGPSPASYTFSVPEPYGDEFVNELVVRFGYRKGLTRTVGEGSGNYCSSSVRDRYPGTERVVRLSQAREGERIGVLVCITGTAMVPGVASIPAAFMACTLLFNYMTADGIVLGYPALTLRLRSLFHVERMTPGTAGGSLIRYARMGVDFRTRPDNWDCDAQGNVRGCTRSWLAPCVRRKFGDRGCLVVSFDGTTVDAQGPGWEWGGVMRCAQHFDVGTRVHMPACTC